MLSLCKMRLVLLRKRTRGLIAYPGHFTFYVSSMFSARQSCMIDLCAFHSWIVLGKQGPAAQACNKGAVALQLYTALSVYIVCCFAVLVAAASCAAVLDCVGCLVAGCVCRLLRALHCLWLEELYSAALPALSVPLCCGTSLCVSPYTKKNKSIERVSDRAAARHLYAYATASASCNVTCYVTLLRWDDRVCRPCCKPGACSHWSGGTCE